MGALDGRVAIVTGAGRGLGREYARLFAAEGARVVVNDVGSDLDGAGRDRSAAETVVEEIRAAGGEAVANTDDVADWAGGARLVEETVAHFGRLDVVVNNAGILRDRTVVNMTEDEWDSVVRVHLRGHFVVLHWAAAYWRTRAKANDPLRASVVNTTSTSGLLGNPGQANYGAAKAGIAALTVIAAQELARYGVRVNAVAPAARTRMTETTPGLSELVKSPTGTGAFDVWAPENVAPAVAWLAMEETTVTGRVFFVQGGKVQLFQPWMLGPAVECDRRWGIEELAEAMKRLVG
jgi:NAD(P)-dependent dehydrogenase (short-subunit alcohol dehydrogenase family)